MSTWIWHRLIDIIPGFVDVLVLSMNSKVYHTNRLPLSHSFSYYLTQGASREPPWTISVLTCHTRVLGWTATHVHKHGSWFIQATLVSKREGWLVEYFSQVGYKSTQPVISLIRSQILTDQVATYWLWLHLSLKCHWRVGRSWGWLERYNVFLRFSTCWAYFGTMTIVDTDFLFICSTQQYTCWPCAFSLYSILRCLPIKGITVAANFLVHLCNAVYPPCLQLGSGCIYQHGPCSIHQQHLISGK